MWRGIRRTNNSLRILATTLAHTLWQKSLSCFRLSNVSLSQQSSCSSCLDEQGLTLCLSSYKTDVNPQSPFVTVLVVSVQDISPIHRSTIWDGSKACQSARLLSLKLLHIQVHIWRLHFSVVTYSPTLATVLISTLFGPFWPCSSHQGSRCGSASSASSLSSSNP